MAKFQFSDYKECVCQGLNLSGLLNVCPAIFFLVYAPVLSVDQSTWSSRNDNDAVEEFLLHN